MLVGCSIQPERAPDRRKRDAVRTLIWESLGQEPPDAGRAPKPVYVLPDFPPWPDGPSDSGPGIAAGNREQIFHPGFTTCPGSPGLGLAVCQTIMQQHGGTITVHSETGRGTTFRLEFPGWGAKP